MIISSNIGGAPELTGNATEGQVLSGQTFYSTDPENKLTGTMTNRGAVSGSVAAGGTYTIPAGYHNGSGKVTGGHDTLSGNATVGNVLSGSTFYSNSATTKQTGTMTNRGAWNGNVAPGASVTIPAGYHNGSGKVTASAADNMPLAGYKLVYGELCALEAATFNNITNAVRDLVIPANCIPVGLKLEGEFSAKSTNSNTRLIDMRIYDNNDTMIFNATVDHYIGKLKTDGGFFSPLAMYDISSGTAPNITHIYLHAQNLTNSTYTTNFVYPRVSVNLWLEKI